MKLYIKTLALGLLLGGALVSCNDDSDTDGAISYPAQASLGIYQNEYTAEGGTQYTINVTLNEKGDTICDVTTLNTAADVANVFSNGKLTYDKSNGMYTATYEDSPYGTPARVNLIYTNDLKKLTVHLYAKNGDNYELRDYFTAVSHNTISYYGDWALADGTVLSFSVPDGDSRVSSLNKGGEQLGAGTYTQSGSTLSTTINGKSYVVTTNDKGQTYVAVDGGAPSYITHTATSLKDDWQPYCMGTYTNWLFGAYECEAEYSIGNRMLRIVDWVMPGTTVTYYWKKGAKIISFTSGSYATGYTHTQDGQQLGPVYGVPASGSYDPEARAFSFNMSYQIPGIGGFGSGIDTYQITDVYDE